MKTAGFIVDELALPAPAIMVLKDGQGLFHARYPNGETLRFEDVSDLSQLRGHPGFVERSADQVELERDGKPLTAFCFSRDECIVDTYLGIRSALLQRAQATNSPELGRRLESLADRYAGRESLSGTLALSDAGPNVRVLSVVRRIKRGGLAKRIHVQKLRPSGNWGTLFRKNLASGKSEADVRLSSCASRQLTRALSERRTF